MLSYDDLTLVPSVIASQVINTMYVGDELSNRSRCGSLIKEVERRRNAMSDDDRSKFIEYCDRKCRDAYVSGSSWMMKCVNADGNLGRDMLFNWIKHWLSGYVFGCTDFILKR